MLGNVLVKVGLCSVEVNEAGPDHKYLAPVPALVVKVNLASNPAQTSTPVAEAVGNGFTTTFAVAMIEQAFPLVTVTV